MNVLEKAFNLTIIGFHTVAWQHVGTDGRGLSDDQEHLLVRGVTFKSSNCSIS
jgi:hypothetical protein